MKKGCIVVNGDMKDFEFHKAAMEKCDFIVAADGAGNHLLKIGVLPDCLIGDMDSIKEEVYEHFWSKNIEVIVYPPQKDKTDTELAIDLMVERGYREALMLGVFGDRADHTMGNIYMMYYAWQKGLKLTMTDENNFLQLMSEGEWILDAKTGQTVSFLSMGMVAEGISLEGFEYPLTDYNLHLGSTRCLSNRAIQDCPKVKLRKGFLLVCLVHREEA